MRHNQSPLLTYLPFGGAGVAAAVMTAYLIHSFGAINLYFMQQVEAASCSIPSTVSSPVTATPDSIDGVIDCTGQDIIVQSGGEIIIERYVDGTGDRTGDWGVTLLVDNLTINAGGKITADGNGYQPGETDASAGNAQDSQPNSGGSGGGHGGAGGEGTFDGTGAVGTAGQAYGFSESPVSLGSAGSNAGTGGVGGAGGGAIKIEASGTVTVNGELSARGEWGNITSDVSGGAGAGGSIWVEAGTLAGNGLVSAIGGSTGAASREGGGGGGGRVSMVCTSSNSFTGSVEVAGGDGGAAQSGGTGSQYGPGCKPSEPTILYQARFDNNLDLPVGASSRDDDLHIYADLPEAETGKNVKLQIEIREKTEAFTGASTHESSTYTTQQPCVETDRSDCASLDIFDLPLDTEYHWRARVFNSDGFASSWVSFGGNLDGDADVTPVNTRIAGVVIVSGDGQTGQVDTTLGTHLVARVVNPAGYGLPEVNLDWEVVEGTGQVSIDDVTYVNTFHDLADIYGESKAYWKIGTIAGSNHSVKVVRTHNSGHNGFFSGTATAGPVGQYQVLSETLVADNEVFSLTVNAQDQYGNFTLHTGSVNLSTALYPSGTATGTISPGSISLTDGTGTVTNTQYTAIEDIKIIASDGTYTGESSRVVVTDSLGACPNTTITTDETWRAIDVVGGVYDCRGLGTLRVNSGATLYLESYDNGDTVYDDGSDYGVTILADSIDVQSGGSISADGYGYGANAGPGASIRGSDDASHGGYGAYDGGSGDYYFEREEAIYGNVYEPTDFGSGGYSNLGGGAVKLVVTGTLTNEGEISADASNAVINEGGASGGSIWIETGTITGTGVITADGGDAHDENRGGGGGRIAIYYQDATGYDLSANPSLVHAYGGERSGSTDYYAGAGTVYLEETDVHTPKHGAIVIDNNDKDGHLAAIPANDISAYTFNEIRLQNDGHVIVLGASTVVEVDDGSKFVGDDSTPDFRVDGKFKFTDPTGVLTITGGNVYISGKIEGVSDINIGGTNPGAMTLDAAAWGHSGIYTFNTIDIASNGTLSLLSEDTGDIDYSNDYGVILNATDISIASGGNLNADGLGYEEHVGPGASPSDDDASHGGYGAMDDTKGHELFRDPSVIYGNVYEPDSLGSGGTYNPGGGAMKINILNTLTLDGEVSSDGIFETVNEGGAAGGSIWINTDTITGTGAITANGGDATDESRGGGGGRIALYYNDATGFTLDNIQAIGGERSGRTDYYGGPGTVYLEEMDNDTPYKGTLVVDNAGRDFGNRAAIKRSDIYGIGTDTNPFHFKKIQLTGYGHLDVIGSDSYLEIDDSTDIEGDSTNPKLTVYGTFDYKDVSNVLTSDNQVDIGIRGQVLGVTDLVAGGTNGGGITLYADAWGYPNGEYTFGTVDVNSNGVLTFGGYDNDDAEYNNDFDTNYTDDHGVILNAVSVTVDTGGVMTAQGEGYTRRWGPGTGDGGDDDASHGGYGGVDDSVGHENFRNPDAIYGNLFEPTDLGSGGGQENGGGAIKLNVASSFTLNGDFNADANDAINDEGGAAGGSIWLITDTLTGTGTIRADGGTGYDEDRGGGGGRVALYFNDATGFDLNSVTAYGGEKPGLTDTYGGPGTVYLEETDVDIAQQGTLVIDNGGRENGNRAVIKKDDAYGYGGSTNPFVFKKIRMLGYGHLDVIESDSYLEIADSSVIEGDSTNSILTVYGTFDYKDVSGVLTADNQVDIGIRGQVLGVTDLVVGGTNGGGITLYADAWGHPSGEYTFGTVDVNGNGTLTFGGYDNDDTEPYNDFDTDYTDDHGVIVNATSITVDTGGILSADGEGYTPLNGPGLATDINDDASHGGYGGEDDHGGHLNFRKPEAIYGNLFQPVDLGTGGYQRSGGGAVKLNIASTFTLNGELTADGLDAFNDEGGSAGGSIWVITNTLTGLGSMSVDGGDGYDENRGGGGGRAAVYYNDATGFNLDNITAYGGERPGVSDAYGGAGTIYLEETDLDSPQQGTLVVDNDGKDGNKAVIKRDDTYGYGTDLNPFQFKKIKLRNYGHLEVIEDTSFLSIADSTVLEGDSTAPKIDVFGTLDYQDASGAIALEGVTLGIKGKIQGVNDIDLSPTETLPSGLRLASNAWGHAGGVYTFNSVDISSGGTVELIGQYNDDSLFSNDGYDTVYTDDNGTTLNVQNMTVDSGALVSGDGYGYPNVMGPGRDVGVNADASHGGYGGADDDLGGIGFVAENTTYGDLYEPMDLGSGGDSSIGGGAFILNVTDSLTLDGEISMDGGPTWDRNGGSSGGSVWITTDTITGLGSISADGGDGTNDERGGGGGRIAVYANDFGTFDYTNPTQIHAYGGKNGGATDYKGGPGTVYFENTSIHEPQKGNLRIVGTSANSAPRRSQNFDLGLNEFYSITVDNTTVRTTFDDGTGAQTILDLDGDFLIGSGGIIDGTGRGYASGTGSGPGSAGTSSAAGGGGGHGGDGGTGQANGGNPGGVGGIKYGDQYQPTTVGSGGGQGNGTSGGLGGRGGSAIGVFADKGDIQIEGAIISDGATGEVTSNIGGGGGAGGSIFLSSKTCDVNGILSAKGGEGGNGSFDGGGGGGGRISVVYSDGPCEVEDVNVTVAGGLSTSGQAGQVGAYPAATAKPITPQTVEQYESNGTTIIPAGGGTGDSSVVLEASIDDSGASVSNSKQLRLEFEVKELATPYDESGLQVTDAITFEGGDPVLDQKTITGLVEDTDYKWRVRVADTVTGLRSNWADYGLFPQDTTIDFRRATVPAASGGEQYESDGVTIIAAEGTSNTNGAVIKANLSDGNPGSQDMRLQVEAKPVGTAFDETEIESSSTVTYSGTPVEASITLNGLTYGEDYKWRYRAQNITSGLYSNWVEYGADPQDTTVDFSIPGLPTLTNELQYRSDGTTLISAGGTTDETTVIVKALVSDPNTGSQDLGIQAEVKPAGSSFNEGDAVLSSIQTFSGTAVESSITFSSLNYNTSYKWRVRAYNQTTGFYGDWVYYNGNDNNADFRTPAGNPDDPVSLAQYLSDGTTVLAHGDSTNETSVVLQVTASDPAAGTQSLRLEAEVKPSASAFDETGIVQSNISAYTGTPVEIPVTISGLSNGESYKWRVRVFNETSGNRSNWVEYQASDPDFVIYDLPELSTSLVQYQSDGVTPVTAGNATDGTSVILEAAVDDSNTGDQTLKLEFEVKTVGTAFDGITTIYPSSTTVFNTPGTPVTITLPEITGLTYQESYKWRVRTHNETTGLRSAWTDFNTAADVADFVVPNAIPTIAGEGQYESDETTTITLAGATDGTTVVIKATGQDDNPGDQDLKLEVEVKEAGQAVAFDGIGTTIPTTPVTESGTPVELVTTVSGLQLNTNYKWRARVINEATGESSDWVDYGANGDSTDFFVPSGFPTISGEGQYESDGTTVITTGGTIYENTFIVKATGTDPNPGDQDLTLEVEVKEAATPFDEIGILSLTPVTYSGTAVEMTLTVDSLSYSTDYKWRARTYNAATGRRSAWVSYADNGDSADVTIIGNPVTPTVLNQYESDGTTPIAVGDTSGGNSVTLSVEAADENSGNQTMTAEFEVKEVGTAFDETGTVTSSPVTYSGTPITITESITGLPYNSEYKWRVRLANTDTGLTTDWASYGGNADTETDFRILSLPLVSFEEQYQANGTTVISEGGVSSGTSMVIKATAEDLNPGNQDLKLEVEVKEANQGISFDETVTASSSTVSVLSQTPTEMEVSITGLTYGTAYKWRVRTVNETTGLSSGWNDYGNNSDGTDFSVVALPDDPVSLGQFETDGTTGIAAGGTTYQTSVILEASVDDPNAGSQDLKLELELKDVGTAFDGVTTIFASTPITFSTPGTPQTITLPEITGLTEGQVYKWRVRTHNETTGLRSNWVNFGSGDQETTTDFVVPSSPTISSTEQYLSDGTTPITIGGTTDGTSVVLEAQGVDSTPGDQDLKVEVELKEAGQTISFDGTGTVLSDPVTETGSTVTIPLTVDTLSLNTSYKWRVRVINETTGMSSNWIDVGANNDSADFTVPAAIPTIIAPSQYQSDGTTVIATGAEATSTTVVLSATGEDPNPGSQDLKLQVEVKQPGQSFDGSGIQTSDPVTYSGTPVAVPITVSTLQLNTQYKWRARIINEATGLTSAWTEYGGNGDVADFVVPPEDPMIASLGQYRSDGTTVITAGGAINETTVIFKANGSDPNPGDQDLRLEVEVKPVVSVFDGTVNVSSPVTYSGSAVEIPVTVSGLSYAQEYKWRARTYNAATGLRSSWVEYEVGDPDFVIYGLPELPSSLTQYESDGTTPITAGGTSDGTSVILEGAIDDPNSGDQTLKFEFEMKPVGVAFDGITTIYPTTPITFNTPGTPVTVTLPEITGLSYQTGYKWRVRTHNETTGLRSGWSDYATTADIADFIVPSGEPTITDPDQYESDGVTLVSLGAQSDGDGITIKATGSDPNPGDQDLRLEVEVKEAGEVFDGTGITLSSAVTESGTPVEITTVVSSLPLNTDYKWRARMINEATGLSSDWVDYGDNGDGTDFTVAAGIPSITGGEQYQTDGTTVITIGSASDTTGVTIKATGSDPNPGDQDLKLEVEVKEAGQAVAFDGTGITLSTAVTESGTPVQIENTVSGLSLNTSYKWRARVINEATGLSSSWVDYGANGDGTDFTTPADPPTMSGENQYLSDGVTTITIGSASDTTGITIKATGEDPNPGDQSLRLEVEVKEAGQTIAFDGTGTLLSSAQTYSGTPVMLTRTVSGLELNTPYKWRARVVNTDTGLNGDWVDFGANNDTADFTIPPQEPTISSLAQYQSDGTTAIPEGDLSISDTVVLSATGEDPNPGSQDLKVEVEVKEVGIAFDGTGTTISSTAVTESGTAVAVPVTVSGLQLNTQFAWRARLVNEATGLVSNWVDFGADPQISTTDFQVPSEAPQVSSTEQYQSDGVTVIAQQGATNDTSVVLEAVGSDPNPGDQTMSAEFEVKPVGTAFDGSGLETTATQTFSGTPLTFNTTITGLTYGQDYKWRVRVMNQDTGKDSGWVHYVGSGDTTDFTVFSLPLVTNEEQYQSDGTTVITSGGTSPETTVVLTGTVNDLNPGSHDMRLEIELKEVGTPFDETGVVQSGVTAFTGTPVEVPVTVSSLSYGSSYKWRVRTVNETTGLSSGWNDYGDGTDTADFSIIGTPEDPSSIGQFRSDGTTTIAPEGYTTGTSVILKAAVDDPNPGSQDLSLEFEVKEVANAFDGVTNIYTTTPVTFTTPGSPVLVPLPEITGLTPGSSYKWRVRTHNETTGLRSGWANFGSGDQEASTDFAVPGVPTISAAEQYQSDGSTVIATGGAANSTTVVLKATGDDPNAGNQNLKLEVEVKEPGQAFDGAGTTLSSAVLFSGTGVEIPVTIDSLSLHTSYKWRARIVNEDLGTASSWTEYGANGQNADFTVPAGLPTITSEAQYQDDGTTAITLGGDVTGSGVVIKATGEDPNPGDQDLKLEVELKEAGIGSSFNETSTVLSSAVTESGTAVDLSLTLSSLSLNTNYKWRARVINEATGLTSAWTDFGSNSDAADFVVPAGEPTISSPVQYRSDGTTVITTGEAINETTVVLSGTVEDPNPGAQTLRNEVEVKETGVAFDETGILQSPAVSFNGSPLNVGVSIDSLSYGSSYKWRIRTFNEDTGVRSSWTEYGGNGDDPDFAIIGLPADPEALIQYESNGTTAISQGGQTDGTSVILEAVVDDPNSGNQDLTIEVELKEVGVAFDGVTNIYTSSPVTFTTPGTPVTITLPEITGLSFDTGYKWRVRTHNETTGLRTGWVDYGLTGDVADFVTPAGIPDLTNANQYESDGTTAITVGGQTDGDAVVIQAQVSDPNAGTQQLKLEVEVKETGTAFTGSGELSAAVSYTGTPINILHIVTGLSLNTDYKWQARVLNEATGESSDWVDFGTNGDNIDFSTPIGVPSISSEGQFESNGTTLISLGGESDTDAVVINATGLDPNPGSQDLRLEVEIKEIGVAYDETGISTSSIFTYTGAPVVLTHTVSGLQTNTAYKWRARILNETTGQRSSWADFGSNGDETDFSTPAGVPTLSSAGQFESDGTTAIATGGVSDGTSVVVTADVADPNPGNQSLRLEVEVKEQGTSFNGIGLLTSSTGTYSGTALSLSRTVSNLTLNTNYIWRVRVHNTGTGLRSDWVEYGGNGTDTDFSIPPGAPTVTSPEQYQSDGTTVIPAGNETTANEVVLSAVGEDPNPGNQDLKVQVELRRLGLSFTGTATHTSSTPVTESGTAVEIPVTVSSLELNRAYKWRIRVVNEATGMASSWLDYGEGPQDTTTDFQVPSGLPVVVSTEQYESDTTTVIPVGSPTDGQAVVIKTVVSDPNPDDQNVVTEVEVKETGTPFDGTGTTTSSVATYSGSDIEIPVVVSGLSSNTTYKWRVRVTNQGTGKSSAWTEYGGNGDSTDFSVQAAAPTMTNHNQYESDGTTLLTVGGTSDTQGITIKATGEDPNPGDQDLKLEVEVTEAGIGASFDGTGTILSPAVTESGTPITLTAEVTGLTNQTSYKWRSRIVNEATGLSSAWEEFEANGDGTDFVTPASVPVVSSPAQYESDGTTGIAEGGVSDGTSVVLSAVVDDANTGDQTIKLEVELKTVSTAFDGVTTIYSSAPITFNTPGSPVTITLPEITDLDPNSSYKWRVRAHNETTDLRSSWFNFGTGDQDVTTDFTTPAGAPSMSGAEQYESDGTTVISLGGESDGTTVILKGTGSDPNPGSQDLKLEVEVKETAQAFDGTGTTISNAVAHSGSDVEISTSISNLSPNTDYKWRARIVNEATGLNSDWFDYGSNSDTTDFSVPAGVPTASALEQYESDGTTAIAVGGQSDGTTVVLKGTGSDPNPGNQDLVFEVEVKETGTSFDGTGTTTSSVATYSGTDIEIPVIVSGLTPNTDYAWRGRIVNQTTSQSSSWVSYGGNADSETDFSVPAGTVAPTSLGQYEANGTTAIPATGSTTGGTVVFKGSVDDENTGTQSLSLQVEIKETGETFDGTTNTHDSDPVSFSTPGSPVEVTLGAVTYPDIEVGSTYKWRARTVNETTGLTSSWTYFNGDNDSTDFELEAVPPQTSNPGQYETDEETPIVTGGGTSGDQVVIKTQVDDPNLGEQRLKVRIEIKKPGESFDGNTDIYESEVVVFSTPGSPVEVSVPVTDGLDYDTDYKWRVQIVNEETGLTSDWVEYGGNGETDADFRTPAAVAPETPATLEQYEADGTTPIAAGATATGTTILVKVAADDTNVGTQSVRAEVEIVPIGSAFEGVVSAESVAAITTSSAIQFSTPGTPVLIEVPISTGLSYEGQYKWRARITNSDTGLSSAWADYGSDPQDTTVDFEMPAAPTSTPTPSLTPTPLPTNTPPPVPTDIPQTLVPTNPGIRPTNTPIPIATHTPAPTSTPGPTTTPGPTANQRPTATTVPPTATPTPTKPGPLVNTGIPVTIALVGGVYFILSVVAVQFVFRERKEA